MVLFYFDRLQNVDNKISYYIFSINKLKNLSKMIEYFLEGSVTFPLNFLLIALSYNYAWPCFNIFNDILITQIIDIILIASAKMIFRRHRPSYYSINASIKGIDFYSFPSGHVSRYLAVIMLLTSKYQNINFSPYSFILPNSNILVMISRVHLGRHYFFDVLGGCLLASCNHFIFNYIYQ